MSKRNTFTPQMLTACAACIAVAVTLSFVPIVKMPQGGSITILRMLFVALPGYFFGPVIGITAAVSYGILDFVLNPWFVHPVQILLDYILGFGLLGVMGYTRNMKNGLFFGFVLGAFGRFVSSTAAGYIFYLEFADPAIYGSDKMSVLWYPVIYNISYIGPEVFITVLIISLPVVYSAIERVKLTFVRP